MFKVKFLGLFLIPILFYGAIQLENFIPKNIHEQFTLGPNALWYSDWQKTPIPVLMKFYFFNWTNYDEFSNRERKLNFNVMGPYAFLETKEKVDIEWRNESVIFKQLKHWYYQPEDSMGSLTDPITSINILLVFALNFMKDMFFQSWFSKFLQSDYFMTKTVDELLFTGYEDILLKLGSMLPFKDIPKQERFGWFYEKNGTTDFDGLIEAKRFGGDILKWNNQTKTTFFPGNCSEIRGSAGELWPMDLKGHYIEMFSPNLCKTFRLNRNPKPVYIKGIQGILYEGDDYLFDNGQIYKENQCFCTDEHCLPNGAQSVAKCRHNSPTYVSSPHFLNSDSDYYRRHIEIPPANKSLHNTYIILEPRTGIALEVAARFQINVLTDNYEFYTKTRFRSVLIPLLWFEQTAAISDPLAYNLKMFLIFDRFYSLIVWLGFSLITFGIFYATVFDILFQLIRRRENVNIFTIPKLPELTLKQLSIKKNSFALPITPIRSVTENVPEIPIILTNLVSNSTKPNECLTKPIIADTAVLIVDSSNANSCDLIVEKEPELKIEDSVVSTENCNKLNQTS